MVARPASARSPGWRGNSGTAKWLIILGVILILAGLAWPWLSRLGLGHLPGDTYIERKGFSFYFPLISSILVSLVLSVLFWILRK